MKKSLIAVMILAITTTALIGCGKKDNSSKNDNSKPIVAGEDTSTNDNKENSTGVDGEEVVTDENTSNENVETPVDNTYSEAEMEEIEAVTTEQIEEYARELGQKYYDYEIDTNVMKKIDGINLYYFAVHSGPPNNTVKEYMLGADGVLYNYQSAINGILQMEQ